MRWWHAIAVIALVWAGIYLPGLGSPELKGEEPRRILPARDMLRTGDFVVPEVAGRPYSRKPPLYNWLVAGTFHATGVQNEWTGRLPGAVSVLVLGVAVVLGVGSCTDFRAGLAAAVFSITNISMVDKGRLAELEGIYVALFGVALATWLCFWLTGRSRWLLWLVPFAFLGLGALVKGPLHLFFFYAIVICVIWRERQVIATLIHPAHFAGWIVFLAIFIPWAWLNSTRNPSGDSGEVWMEQMLGRLAVSEIDWGSWALVGLQSVVNFLPWALFLPLLWLVAGEDFAFGKKTSERSLSLFRGMRMGTVIAFVVIALIPGSRPRYTMPLIVPASILVAWALCYGRGPQRAQAIRLWTGICRALAAVTLVAGVGMLFMGRTDPRWLSWAAGIVAIAVSAVLLVRLRQIPELKRIARLAGASGLAVAMAILCYATVVVPRMSAEDNVRRFGTEIREAIGAEESHLMVYKAGYQPFVFYLGADVTEVWSYQDLPEEVDYVLMQESRWETEAGKLTKRYGEPGEVRQFRNPREWKGDRNFLLIRFGGEVGAGPGGVGAPGEVTRPTGEGE